ncbi:MULTISPECIES: fimbrillin family protein [Bacteroidales]|uniref:fimbrillin family protein n=1 Tax=Bacteroidales TaxID=171549 RepID=UPI001CE1093F|nr:MULTISPECIES: fimbrillin family protein [Bacteroides]MCA5600707.1 fimbrillin family protein [Bacteroides fragilis]MDU7591730.1 fimbrillin family protein [Bacteroides sp.]
MKVHKKNPSWMAGGMATMLLCTLLFSCNNEDFLESGNPEKACDNICFGISSDKNVQTRGYAGSDDEGYTADRFVLRSDDSADTLCVRAIVSEGINVSGFEGEQALTRATPVGKDNFYNKFHVLAYWSKNGAPVDQFYMNTNASNVAASVGTGAIWSTEQIYYWPGADHSFQFYAWAPTDAGGLTTPSSPQEKSLAYTVPEAAADQKDIVVATTDEIQGDNNAAVPLTFKHICTAVRFAVGSQMQPGQIKSVALKGVKNAGTYDMAADNWSLGDATVNFSQTLNKETTGTEANGDAITTSEGTFMMLPQTLPAGATVEVVFVNANNEDRTLTASIGNTEWKMGTTVTYKLSITPEYELEFVSQPEMQDAHYVIYPITIKSGDKLPAGGWTLTSNDAANVTFVEKDKFVNNDVQALVDAGYWLDGYNGTSTLTSTTTGEVQVYVFLKENATEADRNITLSLKPAAQGNYEAKEFSFTQYCPAWNNGIGVERIQDGDYPWGFSWDSNMKITYNLGRGLGPILASLYIKIFVNYSYVTSNWGGVLTDFKVTIDFSKVGTLTTATDLNDGNKNTWELYSFNGLNDASALMAQIESWGGVPDKTLPANPSEFAARACAMKNKYSVQTETDITGNTVYLPVLDQANMVWYLPAQNEAANMNDNLSGDYWTSTAITDPGTTAYKYTVGGSTSPEDRDSAIHVRAVRQKP